MTARGALRSEPARELTVPLTNLAATRAAGLALGRALPARALVLFAGGLGAGKTTLIKAICEALGIAPQVVISPTYTLVNVYPGSRSVYHVDLYRLQEDGPEAGTETLLEMDRDDWVNPDGVTLIEWPQAARPLLAGEPVLELLLDPQEDDPGARTLTARAEDPAYDPVLATLARLPGATVTP